MKVFELNGFVFYRLGKNSGYYNITFEGYVIRPKLCWKISDALTACTGLSYMYGPEGSLFDYSSPVLSGGFLELKVNF